MRLIDADALMEILTTAIRNMKGRAKFLDAEDDPKIQMEIKAYTDIANGIKGMPTIEERKTGKWIHDGYDFPHGNDWIHCSECGKRGINVPADLTNFCPNCGADMRGEDEHRC